MSVPAMGAPQSAPVPGNPHCPVPGNTHCPVPGNPHCPVPGNPQSAPVPADAHCPVPGNPQTAPVPDDPHVRVLTDRRNLRFRDAQFRAVGDPVLSVSRIVGQVCRVLLFLLPVYAVGRLGLSVTWLVIGLFLWMFWNRNKKSKIARLKSACDLLEDESLQVTRGLGGQQLPAWVNFPDVDRVEWINKILKQMWPYFGLYMEKIFQEKIETKIRASNIHLKAFTFTKVNFGEKPPRINGVKAYTKKVDKREVILDLQICYSGDCEINVEVKKLWNAGVKGLQLHGTLRVILAPLMSDVPFVGAVTFFFIQKPFLDINWTGITNLLEIPGVSDMSDGMIVDLIASYLVLPNRFTYPLCSKVNPAQLRFPVPHGVLRVYLYEAEDLIPKDTYLKGLIKGKSDPYAVLRVGTQTFKSKTIRENLNPLWHEMYEFVVHEVPGQDLEIDLYDEDPDKDDFLGSLVISLEGVMKDRVVDEWFPLNDVASGSVHMKLEWYSLLANPEKLCEARTGFSTAMAIVYLDSASGLPKNHCEYTSNEYTAQRPVPMSEREPSSYVLLNIGKKTVKSKTCCCTTEPVWEQAFSFFCQDVHMEHLHMEVKDSYRQCALGMLDVPLHRILSMADLVADQRFPLDHSGPHSFLKMKVVLRVMHIEDPDPDRVYAGLSSLKHGPLSIRRTRQDKPRGKPPSASEPYKPHGKPSSASELYKPHGKPSSASEPYKPHGKPSSASEPHRSPIHLVPPSAVIRRESSIASTRHIVQTAPEEGQPAANQSAGNSTGYSAPQTPKLRHLQRIAPSLISLNSIASSVFDPNDDLNSGLQFGEINISVRYASLRRCLLISINGCRNLIQCSSHGADPYVRIYLLPDRRWANRKKTTIKKKTLNPIYNERFEFLVSLEDAKKRMLDVAVKNNRQFGSQERKEMGKTLVDLSQIDVDQGITDWFELTATGHPTS